jgi:hypothetical protein
MTQRTLCSSYHGRGASLTPCIASAAVLSYGASTAVVMKTWRPKIEGGTFFYPLALAGRGGDAAELSERFGE